MKLLAFIISSAMTVGASAAALVSEIPRQTKLVYQDALVRVVQNQRITFNPHSDWPLILIVGNRRFPWLEATRPYYYKVDDGEKILFIIAKTGMFRDTRTAVLLDLHSSKTQTIDFSGFRWGTNGQSRDPELKDSLTTKRAGRVLLLSRTFHYQEEIELSLRPFGIVHWRKSNDGRQIGAGP